MKVELKITDEGFNLKFPPNLTPAEQAEKVELVHLLQEELAGGMGTI